MEPPEGFEPSTHCLEGNCSIPLSYGGLSASLIKHYNPIFTLWLSYEAITGPPGRIQTLTNPTSVASCSIQLSYGGLWWFELELNQHSLRYQRSALPLSYRTNMAPPTGFEPVLSALTGQCVRPLHHGSIWQACKESNPDQMVWSHLCYHYTTDPLSKNLVGTEGVEPTTSTL